MYEKDFPIYSFTYWSTSFYLCYIETDGTITVRARQTGNTNTTFNLGCCYIIGS